MFAERAAATIDNYHLYRHSSSNLLTAAGAG